MYTMTQQEANNVVVIYNSVPVSDSKTCSHLQEML
jgi:hypothetical protein